MPRLENWSLVSFNVDLYTPPELMKIYLNGNIYNDNRNRFEDGKNIDTSSVQELNLGEGWVKTRNTKYELGKPSEDYLKWLKDNGRTLEDFEHLINKKENN